MPRFHADSNSNDRSKVRQFVGTLNLGVAIPEARRSEANVYIIIKRLMAFAKQTDPDFRIEPINISASPIQATFQHPRNAWNFTTSTGSSLMALYAN
jgi:hypothetical protein